MNTPIIAVTVACTLLIAQRAWAGDIFTPPLSTGDGSATAAAAVNCRVLNTGSSTAKNVTIKLFNDVGVEQETVTADIVSLRTLSLTDLTPEGIVYCRVSGIVKNKARVTLCLLDADSNKAKCTEGVTGQ